MTLQWLLGWWNLIFLAPLAVALLYLCLYTLTGIEFGDGDADADVDVDADADADVDADADADADADHDADAEGDGGHGSFHAMALSWLGVGRVPLSLVLVVLLLTWGVSGMAANVVLRDQAATGWAAARVAVPIALVVSLAFTRAIVMFIGRFMPLNATSAKPWRSLVGSEGEAMFAIGESFGMAAVRDGEGGLQQVACKTAPGIEPIAKGSRVKLVAYREAERMFFVACVDPPPRAAPPTPAPSSVAHETT